MVEDFGLLAFVKRQLLRKLLNLAQLASNLPLQLLSATESNRSNGYDNENFTRSHGGHESTANNNDDNDHQINGNFLQIESANLFTEITNKQFQSDDDLVLPPIEYLNDQPTISESSLDVGDRKEEYEHEILGHLGTNTTEESSAGNHSLATLESYQNASMNDFSTSNEFGYLGVCRYCYLNALEQKLICIEEILREGKENFALSNHELCSRTQIEIFQGNKCIQGQQRRYVANNSDDECRQQQTNAAQVHTDDFAYETLMPQSILQFNISKNINNPEWAKLLTFTEHTDFPCHCNESNNYSSCSSLSSSSGSASSCDEYSNSSSSTHQYINTNDEDVHFENISTDEDQETIPTLAYTPPSSAITTNKESGEQDQHVRTSSTSTNLCIALSDNQRAVRSDVRDTFKLAVEYGANPKRKHYNVSNLETSDTTNVSSSSLCCTTVSDAKSTSLIYNAINAADSAHSVCDEAIDLLPEHRLQGTGNNRNSFVLNRQTTIKLNNNNNNNNSDSVSQAINILDCIPDANRLPNLNLIENMPISRSSNIDIDSIRNSRNFLGKPSNILSEKGSLKNNDIRYEVKSAKENTAHRANPTYSLSKQLPDLKMPDLSKSSKPNHPLLCSHSPCDVGAGATNRIDVVNNTGSGRISSGSGSNRNSTLDGQRSVDSTSASSNLFPIDSKTRRAYSTDEALDKVLPERTRMRRQRRLMSQNSDEAEDPIIRLNRLKARISGALTEVKGVLKQYTFDDTEAEDAQSTLNRPLSAFDSNQLVTPKSPHTESDTKVPVQFRFVKKTKRETVFHDDDGHCAQPISSSPQKPTHTIRTLNYPVATNRDLQNSQGKYHLKNSSDITHTPHNLPEITSSAQFGPTKAYSPDHIRPNAKSNQIESQELRDEPGNLLSNPTQALPSNLMQNNADILHQDKKSPDIYNNNTLEQIQIPDRNREPTASDHSNLSLDHIEKEPQNSIDTNWFPDDLEKPDIHIGKTDRVEQKFDKLQAEFQVKVKDEVAECEKVLEQKKGSKIEIKQEQQQAKEVAKQNKQKCEDQELKRKAEKKVTNKDKDKLKTEAKIIEKHEKKPEQHKEEEKSKRTELENHNKDKSKVKNESKKVELQQNDSRGDEIKVVEKLSKPEGTDKDKVKADNEAKKDESPKKNGIVKVKGEEKLKKKEPEDKKKPKPEGSCKSLEPKKSAIKIQHKTPEKLKNKEYQVKEDAKFTPLKVNTVNTDSPKKKLTSATQENHDNKKAEQQKNDCNTELKITKKIESKEQQVKDQTKVEGNIEQMIELEKKGSKSTFKCEDILEKPDLKEIGKECNKIVEQKKDNKPEVKVEGKVNKKDEGIKVESKCIKDVGQKEESEASYKAENKSQEEPQKNQNKARDEKEFPKVPSANCTQVDAQKDSKANIKDQSLSKKVPSLSKEPSSGANRIITLTANNITANRRRASLAEIENTKIEPSRELCLPDAINRRPSDSGAILKTKMTGYKSRSTLESAKKLKDVTTKDATKSKPKIHKPKDITSPDVSHEKTNELMLTSPSKEQPQQTTSLDTVNGDTVNKTIKQSANECRKLPHLPNITTTAFISTDATAVSKPLIVIDELPLSSMVASSNTANALGTIEAIDQCPNEHKTSTYTKQSAQNVSTATDILENSLRTPPSASHNASNTSHPPLVADEFSESVVASTHLSKPPTETKTDGALLAASSNVNSPKSNRQLAIETANDPHSNKSPDRTTSKASPTNCTANIAKETSLSQFKQAETCAELSTVERTATRIETIDSNAKEFIQSTEIANSYNGDIQSDTTAGKTAASTLNTEHDKMPELQLIPPPVQRIDSIATAQHSLKSTSPTKQLLNDSSSTPEQNYQDSNTGVSCDYRPKETNEIADDLTTSDKILNAITESNAIQTEPSDLQTNTDVTPKKERRVKKKVIINRQRRRLSATDYFFTSDFEDTITTLSDTLEIPIAFVTDDEDDEAGAISNTEDKKPLKSCLKEREYHIGDEVLYAERFKKTQIRWKRGRVKERICSISYLLDVDGKEISAHINYLKAFTKRKVNFSTKEYLDIKYEQLNELEDNDNDNNDDDDNEEETSQDSDSNRPKVPNKKQKYSIWNMV